MQELRHDQVGAAADTLAIAFHDDPLLQVVVPDQDRRRVQASGSCRFP